MWDNTICGKFEFVYLICSLNTIFWKLDEFRGNTKSFVKKNLYNFCCCGFGYSKDFTNRPIRITVASLHIATATRFSGGNGFPKLVVCLVMFRETKFTIYSNVLATLEICASIFHGIFDRSYCSTLNLTTLDYTPSFNNVSVVQNIL